MFANGPDENDRRRALALRIEASGRGPRDVWPTETHRQLAILIGKARPWLVGELSRAMFAPERRLDPEAKPRLVEFAKRLDLDSVSLALSGVSFKEAILCRLASVGDVSKVLALLETRLAQEAEYQASLTPEELERRKAHLSVSAAVHFDLSKALEERRQPADAPERKTLPFDPSLAFLPEAIEEQGEIAIRRMAESEIKAISKAWQDGWRVMSLENAMERKASGPAARHSYARTLDRAGVLFGIFMADGRLAGSLAVMPVSRSEAELGWFVVPEARRQGVATRAVSAAMARLADIGVTSFGARALAANEASRAVMGKLGFVAVPGQSVIGSDVDWISMRSESTHMEQVAFAP